MDDNVASHNRRLKVVENTASALGIASIIAGLGVVFFSRFANTALPYLLGAVYFLLTFVGFYANFRRVSSPENMKAKAWMRSYFMALVYYSMKFGLTFASHGWTKAGVIALMTQSINLCLLCQFIQGFWYRRTHPEAAREFHDSGVGSIALGMIGGIVFVFVCFALLYGGLKLTGVITGH